MKAQELNKTFAKNLLKWYDQHGRATLPWRQDITAYRVWLSEIMLQQTQVNTVLPYFDRFIKKFPTVSKLAIAEQDDIMHLWSGLGYYARARNLHKTAKIIHQDYKGCFPEEREQLETLPGIGRSTAAAIAAIAFQKREAILDGNVKRILARLHILHGWPGKADVLEQLWKYSIELLPESRIDDYTQAIMDLGATLCTRTKPRCNECPVKMDCKAYHSGEQEHFPAKKPKTEKPKKKTLMLLIKNQHNEILLIKRPPTGIWGSLWCFPECTDKHEIPKFCETTYGCEIQTINELQSFKHIFSHFQLEIHPYLIQVRNKHNFAAEPNQSEWFTLNRQLKIGMAAPVEKLINLIKQEQKDLTSEPI